MGILDSVFAGENGLVASLHETFGGTATIKRATFQRNVAEGTVTAEYETTTVPFVPTTGVGSGVDLNAPGTSRSDFKEPLDTLQGSIPTSALDAAIRAHKDTIVYQGVEYLITNVDTLRVGDEDAMVTITATRVS